MKELKGTKTEANLMTAFAGESQARNKYTYYASKAKKEGYEQIAAIFTETANNEKEHAKIWFKLLHDGAVPDTLTNLADAAAGENTSLMVSNVANTRTFEVKTPDVIVKVNPERADLVNTMLVEGRRCLVIELSDHVEVNGISIRTGNTSSDEESTI